MSPGRVNNHEHLIPYTNSSQGENSSPTSDLVCLYLRIRVFKDKLIENCGDNQITKKVMDIYFYLLQSNQSEHVKLKVFSSLRILVNKLSTIFMDGHSSLCANLCLVVIVYFKRGLKRIFLRFLH